MFEEQGVVESRPAAAPVKRVEQAQRGIDAQYRE
jgi:hypothetical protein